jgi:RHS repeat-associated protein
VNAAEGSARFSYDGCGRRLAERYEDRTVGYAWSPSGWLTSVTTSTPEGEQVLEVRVDALGELAEVDGTQLWWDTASPVPATVAIGSSATLPVPGFTGVGGADGAGWVASGWRAARSTSPTDPWSASADAVQVVGAVQVTASGGVVLAGLEWLDARVYDPAVRGFLTTDPLPAVVGAGWAGNPYSYAGNDPLHAVDPYGLRPMTDAELHAYADSRVGAFAQTGAAIGHWWSENWEYVAAGAMIVAGVALMFTGVGGPVGIALMAGSGALLAAGASTAVQKFQKGEVDWGEVGVNALIGGATGAATAGATVLLSSATGPAATQAISAGASRVGSAVTSGVSQVSAGAGQLLSAAGSKIATAAGSQFGRTVISNGVVGGFGNVGFYAVNPNTDFTLQGAASAFGGGFVSGAAVGSASSATQGISSAWLRVGSQLSIAGGGNVAGSALQTSLQGGTYNVAQGFWDFTVGAGASYLPTADQISAGKPTSVDHWGVAGAGQMVDWGVGDSGTLVMQHFGLVE